MRTRRQRCVAGGGRRILPGGSSATGRNEDKETMMWTDERVELLKKLWTDGLSASQIAAQMGGGTRNAVIGKVHRLSLSGRARPASSVPRPRKMRAPSMHRQPRAFVNGNT